MKEYLKNNPNLLATAIVSFSLVSITVLSLIGFLVWGGKVGPNTTKDTINVTGTGKVKVKPDTASFTSTSSVLDASSSEAKSKSTAKLNKVLDVLKSYKVDDANIQTGTLSIYPEYDYTGITSKMIGYRSTQSITVSVYDLEKNESDMEKIVDEITAIDGIEFGGVNFSLTDPSVAMEEARGKALEDAKNKAEQLVEYNDRRLGKVKDIIEIANGGNSPMPYYAVKDAISSEMSSSQINLHAGENELVLDLHVVYEVK